MTKQNYTGKYCERCDKLGFDKCYCSKEITPDFVIKAKAADGGDYVPLYYDNLVRAVVDYRKVSKKAPTIELIDNNTGEILASIENGVTVHEVSFISEIAAN